MEKDNNELCLEGLEIGLEEEALGKQLSNAGKYAYCGICSLLLNKLFYYNELDREFCHKCQGLIITHLELPESVNPIMELILTGEIDNKIDSFLDILNEEEIMEGKLKYLLQDIITLAVQEGLTIGSYDARWKVLIRECATVFGANCEEMELYEVTVVHCLTKARHVPSEKEAKANKTRQRITKAKRYAMIGLATIGGGTLIGITGGLAAPLISAGLVSMVGGSAVLTALSAGAGAAVFGTLFGAAGAGLAGYKMNKRVGEIEEFAFGQLCSYTVDGKGESVITPQLDITIVLCGWIKDEGEDSFIRPWKHLLNSREQYYLRYESTYLLELGRAIEYILSMALTMATQEALKYTVLAGLMSAIAWPAGLVGLASVIDNPWGVCCRRSAQVGKHLADVLLSREHGHRPVTLIGFSLGARVIFYCLREMSERENSTGLIQDAILIGAPCTANPNKWKKITKIVAGKIINGYCKTDWLLRFLYRTLSMPRGGVAGLQPLEVDHPRIVNHDLSSIVSGHGDYPENMHAILKSIGVRVLETPAILRGSHSELNITSNETFETNLPRSKSVDVLSNQS